MRIVSVLFFAIALLNATPLVDRLAKRGKKVLNLLCDTDKIPKEINQKSLEDLIRDIEKSKACEDISKRDLKAVATYLLNKNHLETSATQINQIDVPKDAKCPVCGMFVAKYPKWVALIEVEKKRLYFDGVKDMAKYLIFDGDFKFNRDKISKILVSNYYTLAPIDAKRAFYVVGSNIYGPMGNELIPFETLKEAQNFLKEHRGEKIIRFNEITAKLVLELDGVEYKE